MKKVFLIVCFLLVIFSYGFVDVNFPFKTLPFLHQLVFQHRLLTTLIYIIIVGSFFWFYLWFLKQSWSSAKVWQLIFLTVAILFFAWPAFSYDIFNYSTTAKTIFNYRENPYLVMPIEFLGDPVLKYTHAANKLALYGPAWLLLTGLPYFLGLGQPLLTVFTFKALTAGFYLGLCWLIWRLTDKKTESLIFFALNPLVLMETLVSGHNDVVMMFFVLLAFWLIFHKKKSLSFLALLFSVGIKFATILLTPLLILSHKVKKEKLFIWAAGLMFLAFLASPLREEIYSWYFIWVLVFIALLPGRQRLRVLSFAFCIGLLLRHAPYLYYRRWDGVVPLLKTLITFVPPGLASLICLKK